MGYMRYHTMVVIGWDHADTVVAHEAAVQIFGESSVSNIVTSAIINRYESFFIPPDGGPEGLEESNKGDKNRAIFKDWLKGSKHHFRWVEVCFADEGGDARIEEES